MPMATAPTTLTASNQEGLFYRSIEESDGASPFNFDGWLPPHFGNNTDADMPNPLIISMLAKDNQNNRPTIKHSPIELQLKEQSQSASHSNEKFFATHNAVLVTPRIHSFDVESIADTFDIFVDYLIMSFNIDPDRIYLVSMSFGGGPAWEYAKAYGYRLAVMAPSCSHTDPALNTLTDYAMFQQMIVWGFNAVDDGGIYHSVLKHTGHFSGQNGPGQEGWMGGIAAAAGGSHSTRMLDTYPEQIRIEKGRLTEWAGNILVAQSGEVLPTRSVHYSSEHGWVWNPGMTFVAGSRHQQTLLNAGSSDHHQYGWEAPWGKDHLNLDFWKWLLAQRRGVLPTSYEDPEPESRMNDESADNVTVGLTQMKVRADNQTSFNAVVENSSFKTAALDTNETVWGVKEMAQSDVAMWRAGDMYHVVLTVISLVGLFVSLGMYTRKWRSVQWPCGFMFQRYHLVADKGEKDVGQCGENDNDAVIPTSDPEKAIALVHATPAAAVPRRRHIKAFGVARFIASLHVVAGHLYRYEHRAVPDLYVFEFGFTWVPYFMMMSGFILTYGRLTSSDPQKLAPVLTFVKARLFSIYPLYMTGLFSALALQLNSHGLASFKQAEFIVSLALLQAWIPTFTERVLQPQCWFLSCIVPYWMLHNMLYRKISVLSMRQLLHVLLFCWLAPLVLLFCLATLFHNSEWYLDHHWQDTRGWSDIIVIMLKFHPFCYMHIYVFGIATACLYVKMEGSTTSYSGTSRLGDAETRTRSLAVNQSGPGSGCNPLGTLCLNYGVSLGYVGLLTIFVASKWVPVGLSLRLGFLAPLHGITMIGMVRNHDPLSRFFSYGWLPALGNLSYPQYIFQFICFSVWGRAFASFGFWAFLAACSVVGYVAIQKPLKELNCPLRPKAWGLLAMGIVPLLFGGLGQLSSYSEKMYPPSFDVSYVNGAIDTRLVIVIDEMADQSMSPNVQGSFYINPSLLFEPTTQRLVAVVRKHRMRVETMSGLEVEVKYLTASGVQASSGGVTYQRIIWESEIGISDVDPMSYTLLHSLKKLAVFSSQASFCEIRPTVSPHNLTIGQLVADGPQDPRLFISPTSELWLSFFAYPVTSSPGESCSSHTGGKMYHAQVPFHWQEDLSDGGLSHISTNASQLIGVDRVDYHKHGPGVNDTSFPVISSSFPKDYMTLRSEKNWLAFTHDATLYYITDMHPFTVTRVVNGSSSRVELARSYYYPLFTSTQMQHPDMVFHGGANPLLMPATDMRPSFYLGVFHTLENGTYVNYAFEFMDVDCKFEIIRVSRPLPLRLSPKRDASISRPLGFVSGLTQHPNTQRIIFSYGSSNAESRVLSMSLETLEGLFTQQ